MIETINDRISWFTDLAALRRGSFSVLAAVQTDRSHAVQYLAPAVAFVALAEALGRDPHEDIARIRRMMNDVEGPFSEEVAAIRDYAKGELLPRHHVKGVTP